MTNEKKDLYSKAWCVYEMEELSVPKIKISSHMFSKLQSLVFTLRNATPTPFIFFKHYKITVHRGILANYI